RTKDLTLRCAEGTEALRGSDAPAKLRVAPDVLDNLVGRYGGEARTLAAMVSADASLGQPLLPSLPYLRAEAVYAARYEMAQTIEDVLGRRTRALLLARDTSAAAAPDVAALVGPELGWSADETTRQVEDYRRIVAAERGAAALPETVLA